MDCREFPEANRVEVPITHRGGGEGWARRENGTEAEDRSKMALDGPAKAVGEA